jgi:GTP:adenosylcobinamide-phosphate guanylyltransferase
MDAIVMAGGIPREGDPLYEYTQGEAKALLEIAGKPMIQWVLDALNEAEKINQIVIIGLSPDSDISSDKLAALVPNQDDMIENVRSGLNKVLEINPNARQALVVSSDIPAITPEAVDWAVSTVTDSDDDIYYNVISRQVMEKRFPESKRSYIRLKGIELCGADMNVISTRMASSDSDIWNRLANSRKNPIKQAALIGFDTLFLLIFRLVTLDEAAEKVTKKLNIRGRAIVCPHAEVGMDVDKPFQLEILRNDLAKRDSN